MAVKNNLFQPGLILHQVIDGVFRSNGITFNQWCEANGIHPSTARNATFGQSAGDGGDRLRSKIIDAAGRDVVVATYRRRMIMEAQRLQDTAA